MEVTSATAPPVADPPFSPREPGYLEDPYPRLAALRGQGPCVVDPSSGRWFLTTFAAVEAGLSQIVRGQPEGPDRHQHFPGNPFAADGPGHTVPRRIITPALSNRGVQRYRARVQEIVDDVLAGKDRGGELRVVEELGFRLPYELTCELLGIPQVEDQEQLRTWTWQSLELIDAFLTDEELQADLAAAARLAEHLEEVAAWKRGHLGDDLFSAVIAAGDEGEVLRPEQVVPYVHTLYLAGMHTTVNQTALGLLAILGHPDQWRLLLAQPALLENAVEELLRFEPTAQYMRRSTVQPIEIEGVTIPASTDVVCWIASANRDEARWGPTADQLDITRSEARHHLAFGKGAHVCVGSWLARLELQVVLATIAERFPRTELPAQELTWSSNVIRGPEELVVRLRPAA